MTETEEASVSVIASFCLIGICFGFRASDFGFANRIGAALPPRHNTLSLLHEDPIVNAKLLLPLVGFVTLAVGLPAAPQQKAADEPLADQVRKSIDKGVKYLRNAQKNGRWETTYSLSHPGGQTALAVLALLNSGAKADDPAVKAGLEFLRSVKKPGTYVRALQTLAFVEAGLSHELGYIRENVDYLLSDKSAFYDEAGNLLGWGYTSPASTRAADASNTQYALLAIWVAHHTKKAPVSPNFWDKVRALYTRTQQPDGGWTYAVEGTGGGGLRRGSYLTMTCAGLTGLLMSQMELNADKKDQDPVAGCGVYPENKPLKDGFAWLHRPPPNGHDRFTIDFSDDPVVKSSGPVFYDVYGLERLGRLSGERFIGPHDWYREGCTWLVKRQEGDGSWSMPGNFNNDPVVSTSFSLLFLSKGRTPVLVSKLAHGPRPRSENDQDWNRRKNDLRHLVEFTSENVFKKMPLAWQIFDIERAAEPREGQFVQPEQLRETAGELLQTPIVYITGHESPLKRITEREVHVLREYVENGGFIFAVACCGAEDFSKGFEDLCGKLWPHNELTPLPLDHPVWNMRFDVKPGSVQLKGLQMGCKTAVILCTQNLTGYWELNRHSDKGPGETAFQVGANVIAYATGLEAPKPRLTKFEIAVKPKQEDLSTVQRGYLEVGQLISQVGEEADWKPAPEAMTRLMQYVRERSGLDVVLKTTNVAIASEKVTNYKFLYMHGRKEFKFTSAELEWLRFNLKHGGLLLADACCGREAFDTAFRQLPSRDAVPTSTTPWAV